MRKLAFAVMATLLLSVAPAYAQTPEVTLPETTVPETTNPAGSDQYGNPELQSIENGLENAGEHADDGAAVGGVGAYLGALGGEVAQAETAPTPSDLYTELPDTGGFSLTAVGVAVALIAGGGLLFWFALGRRG